MYREESADMAERIKAGRPGDTAARSVNPA